MLGLTEPLLGRVLRVEPLERPSWRGSAGGLTHRPACAAAVFRPSPRPCWAARTRAGSDSDAAFFLRAHSCGAGQPPLWEPIQRRTARRQGEIGHPDPKVSSRGSYAPDQSWCHLVRTGSHVFMGNVRPTNRFTTQTDPSRGRSACMYGQPPPPCCVRRYGHRRLAGHRNC